ncbi:type II secretion system protein N [Thiomicrospira cyclica]|nr:type II secretion system protein N [Thiomicrospira cyclica]
MLVWQAGVLAAKFLAVPVTPPLPVMQSLSLQKSIESPIPLGLWGESPAVASASFVPVQSEPIITETRLNFQLIGVIRQQDKQVAIIQAGRDVRVLAVGDQLPNNVALAEVGADFVMLRNQGRLERLSMVDNAMGLLEKSVENPTDAESPLIEQVGLDAQQQTQLRQVSQQVRQSPMAIGQYVRFEGVKEGSNWLGIRIAPRNHPDIFSALGFREGDLVTSINGITVAEMAENPTVWNQFLQDRRFSLVINRNGLAETIEVDLSAE